MYKTPNNKQLAIFIITANPVSAFSIIFRVLLKGGLDQKMEHKMEWNGKLNENTGSFLRGTLIACITKWKGNTDIFFGGTLTACI